MDYDKLRSDRLGESSADIRARVEAARARQRVRFADSVNIVSNSDMRVAEVRQFCKLDEAGESLVGTAMIQVQLSARAYHRILKLARTIADLAGSERDPVRAPGGGVAVQAKVDGGMIVSDIMETLPVNDGGLPLSNVHRC